MILGIRRNPIEHFYRPKYALWIAFHNAYTQLSSYTQCDTDRRINGLMGRLRLTWGE